MHDVLCQKEAKLYHIEIIIIYKNDSLHSTKKTNEYVDSICFIKWLASSPVQDSRENVQSIVKPYFYVFCRVKAYSLQTLSYRHNFASLLHTLSQLSFQIFRFFTIQTCHAASTEVNHALSSVFHMQGKSYTQISINSCYSYGHASCNITFFPLQVIGQSLSILRILMIFTFDHFPIHSYSIHASS